MSTGTTPYCYRHPERESHIRCQRCDRPICPDCMNEAAVGFHCPDCVKEGVKLQRQARTAYGGRRPADPTLTSKVLIGINVAVWLLIRVTGGHDSVWLDRLALLSVGRRVLLPDGSIRQIEGVADGAWWQLLTSMFTHVDFMHLAFNMLALWFLGPQLEAVLGRARFLTLYLLSGLMGSALVYWLTPALTQTVGASGAIFGMLGALLVIAVKMKADYSQILLWLGLGLVITVLGRGMSWQGHLGGLLGGVLIALVMVYSPRKQRPVWQAVGTGLIALGLLGAVVARTLMLS